MFRPAARPLSLKDRRGVAAVEFALLAPVMMIFMAGTAELSNAYRIQAKVNTATGALAVMVAAQQSVTAPSGSLADRCVGAALDLAPFPSGALAADIVSITNDHPSNRVAGSTDTTTVQTYLDWENVSSCPTRSPSTMSLSGAVSLANSPSSLLTSSGSSSAALAYSYSVIVVRTTYNYSNVLSYFLGQTITINGTAVARPRSNVTITCTNVAGTASCPPVQ